MSMSNQVTVTNKNYIINPTNLNEAMNYAKLVADSTFCPKEFKGKTGDVLIAMQMGAEIGLSPMQALQNIAVINGKPCIYGDAALAVVMGHSAYISHREWFEGSIAEGNLIAYCAITRKNSEEYVKSFSMEEAKKANLWSKQGVWQQYPSRMLQMRARAFCIRDKFADALRGINFREEVEDYEIKSIKPVVIHAKKNIEKIESRPVIEAQPISKDDFNIDDMLLQISQCVTSEVLQDVFTGCYKELVQKQDKEGLKRLIEAKDKKKSEINMKSFNEEIDQATGEIKNESV